MVGFFSFFWKGQKDFIKREKGIRYANNVQDTMKPPLNTNYPKLRYKHHNSTQNRMMYIDNGLVFLAIGPLVSIEWL
jgi:hypothetical protein